jgi:hypothetical protein
VPHAPYLELDPDQVVAWAGHRIAVVDCFGILSDDKIRRYLELGCEVKGLGRGHIMRIKAEVRGQGYTFIPQSPVAWTTNRDIHKSPAIEMALAAGSREDAWRF